VELELLRYIRAEYGPDITLRLDANGAFSPSEALDILNAFAAFGIHSIEQPLRAGQADEMANLCRTSPIPIALDEELIGVETHEEKAALLNDVKPPFIILKPTLLGGLHATREWIALAEARNIGWWITSALESNIGLNAIAQFTAEMDSRHIHGLGTGGLFENNIASPLYIHRGALYHCHQGQWDFSTLAQD
jgi:L-alanine-DL-glutamate epimerase-like enolase superfamily enzyme